MTALFAVVLLISALLFLGTVGYLIANADAVARLFGKQRRDAEDGEVIVSPRPGRREASPGAVKTVLALHALGIVGLVAGGLAMSGVLLRNHPDAAPLPPEMDPVADVAGSPHAP